MIRLIPLLTIISLLGACSYIPSFDEVLPDNRDDYKKSEPLPDLEVPPDLTAGATTDAMTIPGEGASLSRYQQQRRSGRQGAQQPAASSSADSSLSGEQWVSVDGSRTDIWPRLETFFRDRGYGFELNDRELGVMETTWSESMSDGNTTYQDKFKLFTEAGAEPGVTVLFISNERREQAGAGESADWINQGSSNESERMLAGELNQYFGGSRSANAGTSTSRMAERMLAQLEDAGDDKVLLALPEEFTSAWRSTATVLERAGFAIMGRDQGQGTYHINYYDRSAEKGGWLSKLAFWKSDESEAIPYILSLTGAGDRTEVIVLNDKGDWQVGEDADRILRIIRNEYNRL